MAYTADVRVMPVLMDLHECLCTELEKSGLSADCACLLVHGNVLNVAPPTAGKGVAWVGIQSIYPSKTFPSPVSDRDTCVAPLAALVTVGLLRCYAVKVNGESYEDMLLWMDKQMADMAAMRRAIVCCGLSVEDISLGVYTPIGPEGGVYGGTWTVTLGQPNG